MFITRCYGRGENKPVLVYVWDGLKPPLRLHLTFCINLYVTARLRITLANTSLRSLDYGGIYNCDTALLKDDIPAGKLAVYFA